MLQLKGKTTTTKKLEKIAISIVDPDRKRERGIHFVKVKLSTIYIYTLRIKSTKQTNEPKMKEPNTQTHNNNSKLTPLNPYKIYNNERNTIYTPVYQYYWT